MQVPQRWNVAVALGVFMATTPAHAGMTVYGLNEIYHLRFEEISFFFILILICGLIFKTLWNHAFKGFASVPRLKYPQALSLVLLFGVAMLLILTMISGIREVLTPGAWRKQGTSYKLNDPAQEPARLRSLQQLRTALFEYAKQHDGKFPANDFVPEIPDKLWESPDQFGTHYSYVGGLTTSDADVILAVEPATFGDTRFALTSRGQIENIAAEELAGRLTTKKP